MNKGTILNNILYKLNGRNYPCVDVWINNSDGEGEDIQVERITPNGLEMCDGDFYPWEDLSEEELILISDEIDPHDNDEYYTDCFDENRGECFQP